MSRMAIHIREEMSSYRTAGQIFTASSLERPEDTHTLTVPSTLFYRHIISVHFSSFMNTKKEKIKIFFTQPKVSFGVFLLFIALSVGVTWFAGAVGEKEQRSNLLATHGIGEKIQTRELTLSVEGVRRDEIGAGPLVPRAGYEFIIPTITLKNTSEKPFDLIPLLYFHIKDNKGNVYNVVAIPSDSAELSGKIPPHDMIREEIGFEVIKGAQGLLLHFDPGTFDQQTVVVNLEQNNSWGLFK